MRRTRGALGAGALAGVLALAGCGQPTGGGTGAAPAPGGTRGGAEAAVQERVGELVARVEQVGRAHPESYAGVVAGGDRVRVHRVPSAPLDAALRALPGAERLDLRDAPHPARDLERLRDRVVADADALRAAGAAVSSVGVRPDGTAVELAAPDADRARAVLAERYGAGAPLAVVRGGPAVPVGGAGPAGGSR